eukprot:gene28000-36895_t
MLTILLFILLTILQINTAWAVQVEVPITLAERQQTEILTLIWNESEEGITESSADVQVRSFCKLHELSESVCQTILSYVLVNYAILASPKDAVLSGRGESHRLTPVASVRSFDIFDTILARSVAEPEDIFSLVEEHFPCPNFRAVRQYAASISTGSFDAIYDTMQTITDAEPTYIQALKEYEFAMELN